MANLNSDTEINISCSMLFALFYVIMLTVYGFGVFFLETLGLPYAEIGLTIAISAFFASILQALLGRFVDTHHYSWQKIVIILNLLIIISVLALFIIPHNWSNLIFGLIIIATGGMYPFITYSPFYYENYGIKTNFGVSRGFGSLSFTIFSLIIGFLLTFEDVMIIPLFCLAASILIIVLVYFLPDYGYEEKTANTKSLKSNILLKYPVFTLIFIASIFIMSFQNLFECYLINIMENIGGNISNVGVSNSIAAILELPVLFFFVKILNKISAKKLIIIASVFYLIRAVMIFFASDPFDIYISQILQIASFAILLPASVHFANEYVDENDQYEAQALLGATTTIGLIFANFVGGNVLQFYDINHLLLILVVLTFLGCIFSFSTLLFKKNP